MARLRTLTAKLRVYDPRVTKPPAPKQADPHYVSVEHRAWARAVIARAGGRCQWPGCNKAAPEHRMVADHIVELRDGGAPLALGNGQCLCVQHNTLKGAQARAARMGAPAPR